MRKLCTLLLFQVACGLSAVACTIPAAYAFDVVVVRPAAWAPALNDWKAYREAQGYRIAELDARLGQQPLRRQIAELYAAHPHRLRYVLLAGDVSPAATSVPTFYHASTAMRQFGGDELIASDNPFGDIDGDDKPELAVGRVPADSADQLASVLQRVIAFEQHADYSTWRRDVHVVAGVGGFGPLADSVIEMTTRRFLADRIPGWSEMSLTQASLQSHYCPDPWRFSEACLGRMNQGGMFWVYIGHGHVKTLDYVRAEEEWLPILTHEHVPAVDVGNRPPIAVFLACYTGAFDAMEDSLAEQLVLSPTGPIAALAASRVSGPYGLAMLSDGLLSSCFDEQTETLGGIVLAAKQRLLEAPPTDDPSHGPGANAPPAGEQTAPASAQMQMIGAIASALSPVGYDLQAERREHVWEMNLLGDPLLRVCHPQLLQLELPARVEPGQTLPVRGVLVGEPSSGAELTLELAYRREQVRRELDQLANGDLRTAQGRDDLQVRYQTANQRVLVTSQFAVSGSDFACQLQVPPELPNGKYAIRAFLRSDTGWAAGYGEITVRAAAEE